MAVKLLRTSMRIKSHHVTGTAPDRRVDAEDVPDISRQHSLGKSGLPDQLSFGSLMIMVSVSLPGVQFKPLRLGRCATHAQIGTPFELTRIIGSLVIVIDRTI